MEQQDGETEAQDEADDEDRYRFMGVIEDVSRLAGDQSATHVEDQLSYDNSASDSPSMTANTPKARLQPQRGPASKAHMKYGQGSTTNLRMEQETTQRSNQPANSKRAQEIIEQELLIKNFDNFGGYDEAEEDYRAGAASKGQFSHNHGAFSEEPSQYQIEGEYEDIAVNVMSSHNTGREPPDTSQNYGAAPMAPESSRSHRRPPSQSHASNDDSRHQLSTQGVEQRQMYLDEELGAGMMTLAEYNEGGANSSR